MERIFVWDTSDDKKHLYFTFIDERDGRVTDERKMKVENFYDGDMCAYACPDWDIPFSVVTCRCRNNTVATHTMWEMLNVEQNLVENTCSDSETLNAYREKYLNDRSVSSTSRDIIKIINRAEKTKNWKIKPVSEVIKLL
jgi:hypothetical protein